MANPSSLPLDLDLRMNVKLTGKNERERVFNLRMFLADLPVSVLRKNVNKVFVPPGSHKMISLIFCSLYIPSVVTVLR